MRLRVSLFTRILLWFFLNLLVIAGVLLIFFNLQYGLSPTAALQSDAGRRIGAIASLIVDETRDKTLAERDAVLRRYRDAYQVDFKLYANTGQRLGGDETPLPTEVLREITKGPPPGAPDPAPPKDPLKGPPVFTMRTANPARYWVYARIPVLNRGNPERIRATLLISSDSQSGNGLFFNPAP